MALTEFQKKNPFRPIAGPDSQSYLGRSFAQGRLDDMEHWWTSGAVHRVFAHEDQGRAWHLMNTVVRALPNWPDETAVLWWPRLWEAGASSLGDPADRTRWLVSLVGHRPSCSFLRSKMLSVHAPVGTLSKPWQEHPPVSACLVLLEDLIEQSSRCTDPFGAAVTGAEWARLEDLWKAPGWVPEQQMVALCLLTRAALNCPHGPDLARWRALRDDLLDRCPDRWQGIEHGKGLLKAWLHEARLAAPSFPSSSEEPDADADVEEAVWHEWSAALVGGPQRCALRIVPHHAHDERHQMVALAPYVGQLADWGIACWGHEDRPRHQTSGPGATVVHELIRPDPVETAWKEGWWQGWKRTAEKLGAPPEAWQEAALSDWLKSDLWWMHDWARWAEIGQWSAGGMPPKVASLLRSQGLSLIHTLTFPDMAAQLLLKWQDWGAFRVPDAPPPTPDALTQGHRSMPLATLRWLCREPELHPTTLALARACPEFWMPALWLSQAAESSSLNAELLLKSSVEIPRCRRWMEGAGGGALVRSLMALAEDPAPPSSPGKRQHLVVSLALSSGAPVPCDWSHWANGVRGALSGSGRQQLFAPGCPWLFLAHQLHDRGLQWETGAPTECPLSLVVAYAAAAAGATAVEDMLAAGADPEAVPPSMASSVETPSQGVWRAVLAKKALEGVLPASDTRPRMRL